MPTHYGGDPDFLLNLLGSIFGTGSKPVTSKLEEGLSGLMGAPGPTAPLPADAIRPPAGPTTGPPEGMGATIDLEALIRPEAGNVREAPLVGNQPNILERLANMLISPVEYPEQALASPSGVKHLAMQAVNRLAGGRGDPESEDAWKLYLGLEQENDSFEESPFKPSQAEDPDAKYLRLRSGTWDRVLESAKGFIYDEHKDSIWPPSNPTVSFEELHERREELAEKMESPNARVRTLLRLIDAHDGRLVQPGDMAGLTALANFTLTKGEDERGSYIALYDKWDLNQPLEGKVGEPFEIYDRMYYDPETFEPIDLEEDEEDQSNPSRNRKEGK